MREKILINDLKVLYLCPSLKWGSVERKVIDDCRCLRDSGGSPSLFCIKGSPIDLIAEKLALPRLFYRGKKVNRFFDVTYYIDLKNVLKENEFEIVHFYGTEYARQICFLLRSLPNIPLIFTCNQTLESKMDRFWDHWLMRRIDSVLTFCEQVNDFLPDYFPVAHRKFLEVGAGVESFKLNKDPNTTNPFEMLTVISDPYERIDLKTLLHALDSLRKLLPTIKLRIVTEFKWDLIDPEGKILLWVLELGLSDWISLAEQVSLSEELKSAQLLVGLNSKEPISVIEIMANFYNLPVVAPRTAARRDYVHKFSGLMETYLAQDARELKDKILKIQKNYAWHNGRIAEYRSSLVQAHGIDSYLERLWALYVRLYAKRARFVSAQKK
jgi:glycosyltransferase involved in cell wall biosynthesis